MNHLKIHHSTDDCNTINLLRNVNLCLNVKGQNALNNTNPGQFKLIPMHQNVDIGWF